MSRWVSLYQARANASANSPGSRGSAARSARRPGRAAAPGRSSASSGEHLAEPASGPGAVASAGAADRLTATHRPGFGVCRVLVQRARSRASCPPNRALAVLSAGTCWRRVADPGHGRPRVNRRGVARRVAAEIGEILGHISKLIVGAPTLLLAVVLFAAGTRAVALPDDLARVVSIGLVVLWVAVPGNRQHARRSRLSAAGAADALLGFLGTNHRHPSGAQCSRASAEIRRCC